MYMFVHLYVFVFRGSPILRENVLSVHYRRYNQTYSVQSLTVTELITRVNCGLVAVPRTVPVGHDVALRRAVLEPTAKPN